MQRQRPLGSPRKPQGHGRVAFLPYVPIRLRARKPKPFPETPHTLGDHIKRCRLARKLTQKEAGKLFGVTAWTVLNWEKGKTEPPTAAFRAILGFLGYDPFPPPRTLSERLLACRRTMGWSVRQAARHLGVHEDTWASWEAGTTVPHLRGQATVEGFLDTALGEQQKLAL